MLKLAIYSPLSYVLPDRMDEYNRLYDITVREGKTVFRQLDREINLISLMRVNILKRLESSVNSFAVTVEKILEKTQDQLKMVNAGFEGTIEYDIGDIDIDDPDTEGFLIGNKIKVLISDLDLYKLKGHLESDVEKLQYLYDCAVKVNAANDKKLQELKDVISDKLRNPINENNKKVLIFTAFADTAHYLYDNIAGWLHDKQHIHSALVRGTGANKCNFPKVRTDYNSILTNFSVKAKMRDRLYPDIKGEIDVLIATDCISEGQNLQDCDAVINYDIHWNPVRIIQRFGRIDRLGSHNKQIKLINFWPNVGLDEYIDLEARVKNRMVLLDVSATGEENIIRGSDINKMNDLEYRRKQLEQLQKEIVDLEEISGGINITDLTLDDFKMDLVKFINNYPDRIEKAPTGIHAVVPIKEKLQDELEPGVFFCLKQVSKTGAEQETNSLHPYYLVYVTEEGEIKHKHTQAKKILDLYKGLCGGENEVYEWLCEQFNDETADGTRMQLYSKMLESAI